jgi:hypothetical protein
MSGVLSTSLFAKKEIRLSATLYRTFNLMPSPVPIDVCCGVNLTPVDVLLPPRNFVSHVIRSSARFHSTTTLRDLRVVHPDVITNESLPYALRINTLRWIIPVGRSDSNRITIACPAGGLFFWVRLLGGCLAAALAELHPKRHLALPGIRTLKRAAPQKKMAA